MKALVLTAGLLLLVASPVANADIMYASGGTGTTLISVDLSNGNTTTFSPHGSADTYATAFTPDGTLWTVTNPKNPSLAHLATFDLATGATTNVGSALGIADVCSLEADAAGNLFAATLTGGLHSVNKITGALTFIGNSGSDGHFYDFAFDNSGKLWSLHSSHSLYSVNTSTGAATFEKSITGAIGTATSLAVDTNNNFFLSE